MFGPCGYAAAGVSVEIHGTLTLENMRVTLFWDVQVLCRTGPSLHCLWHSGEWHRLSPVAALRRVGPVPCPRSTVELSLVACV